MLFASLVASLFSAFLAMLGKQWLNRYASTDMRGTAIERSQNRQRKLDGIITWYFNHVMEALPLMLQIALLLLGCALSRYLWEINITVASVVLSVTSFGLIIYIFIIAAGAASESCPYQTPGSQALRYLGPKIQSVSASAAFITVLSPRNAFRKSQTFGYIATNVRHYRPWWSGRNIMPFLKDMVLGIPRGLVIDAYHFGRAMVRTLSTFPARAHRLGSAIVRSLVSLTCRVRNGLHGTSSTPEQILDQQAIVLDSRCISWMVQTSLDKAVHLSTLKHLATTTALADFDPTLVTFCFDVFIGCISIGDYQGDGGGHRVMVRQGLEQFLTTSAMCCLRTISHTLAMDPKSRILEDIRQRYIRVFPFKANFNSPPFSHVLGIIHYIFYPTPNEHTRYAITGSRPLLGPQRVPRSKRWVRLQVPWEDYKLSSNEHIVVAHALTKIAWFECQEGRRGKVPRWLLRFVLYSLFQCPPPPTSVVVDCLSIVAIDLGHNPSNALTLDERYVRFCHISTFLTKNQCTQRASLRYDKSYP
jgi:hypothetical protein